MTLLEVDRGKKGKSEGRKIGDTPITDTRKTLYLDYRRVSYTHFVE